MSLLDTVPGRTGGEPDRGRYAPGALTPLRTLLRITVIEARRSSMPLMLPLAAALFWFDAVRSGQGLPPVWTQRASILPDHVLPDLGPISAGWAAWAATREHRRGMLDLAESTAYPRWLRLLSGWAGALAWTLLAYAACTATVYVLAARVTTWGGPPVWPVVVTGLAVALFCTVGFVAGTLFPSRFTAPLAALGSLFVSVMVFQDAVSRDSGWYLLSPNDVVPPLDWGVFRPLAPDLWIVQTIFLTGAVVLLLAVLGLVSSARDGRLRRTAAVVCILGLTASVTGFALATTASRGTYGYTVPALHDAADDQPYSYTPVCTAGATPVCIHPAFESDLHYATADFGPVLAQVAGLPGAPTRVTEVDPNDIPVPQNGPGGHGSNQFDTAVALSGTDLEYSFADAFEISEQGAATQLRQLAAQTVFDALVTPNNRSAAAGHSGAEVQLDAAQQAVVQALDTAAGTTPVQDQSQPSTDPAVTQAAQRFAALSPTARHTWLAANLTRLRVGDVNVRELP
jgi:hypothetical protein